MVLRRLLGSSCWPSGWDSGLSLPWPGFSLVGELRSCSASREAWLKKKKKKEKRKKRILLNLRENKMRQILFVCGDVINVTFQTLSWMQCFQYFLFVF